MPRTPRKQTSAIERLQALPAVFRGPDLTVRFQWQGKTASNYLYLWKRRGLVEALGGHSDVYVNKLVTQHPDWERALLMAMPSAVIVGVEALRRAGWTTQVPQLATVAVNKRQSVYKTDKFDVEAREPGWFTAVAPGLARSSRAALPVLAPAWALADLLRRTRWDGTGLGPDDIDWEVATQSDEEQWIAACMALGLPGVQFQSLREPGLSWHAEALR